MNKILSDYYESVEISNVKAGVLEKETTRIVKIITKFFKCKKDWWWSYDYYEGDNQPPPQRVGSDGYFPIYISTECNSNRVSYDSGFPVSFFDMTDQEIIAYLEKESNEDAEKYRIKNEKAEKIQKKSDAQKAKLKESALSKLTAAEKKALKL